MDPLAHDVDLAGVDGVRAEDGAGDLGATGAHQPGEANDLTLLDVELMSCRVRPRLRLRTSRTISSLPLSGTWGEAS